MDIYLASAKSYISDFFTTEGGMDYYLAGVGTRGNILRDAIKDIRPNILESFAGLSAYVDDIRNLTNKFILDSGAFTYLNGTRKGNANWEQYVKDYATYVTEKNIPLYFELDIDPVVGYDKVREFRHYLEKNCPTPPIPVWHKSRGLEDFRQMCKDYDYVAIGGIVTKEIVPNDYPALARFIEIAHKNDAKIHGLGFTKMEWLKKLHFDSVDSTTWLSGNMYKHAWKFQNGIMKRVYVTDNHRIKDTKMLALHNFIEWCKFSKYAEKYL